MKKEILPQLMREKMIKDRRIRRAITTNSHLAFFHFYFAHYVKYPTAPFQREIFRLSEQEEIKSLYIVAFRGSGKSTIITTSYPIWAILGKQQKKFVIILSQTQIQAKQHLINLKRELENNELLKRDLGPFHEEAGEWGATSLVFTRLNAKIMSASSEQSIRGIRHNQHRPDLIIGDDIEDMFSTKTRDGRDKTDEWLSGEIIPAGDKDTRLILVGNLLHEDSVMMRIKEKIKNNLIEGVFKEYPLIKDDKILWPGKYTSDQDIEDERKKAGNPFIFQREYLLKIVPREDQVIHRSWIKYYDKIPGEEKDKAGHTISRYICIGVDLAVSEKETADYTAITPIMLIGEVPEEYKFYVLPNIINKRMAFPESLETCIEIYRAYEKIVNPCNVHLITEDVGCLQILPQQLKSDGIENVRTISPGRDDKRTRLNMTAGLINSGRILFPKEGAEKLIDQIVNFGIEKHDDLADAFSCVIISVYKKPVAPNFVGIF